MLLYACLLAYMLQFLYRLYRTKRVTGTVKGHFRDVWNIVDLIQMVIMTMVVLLRVSFFLSPERVEFNPFLSTSYLEIGNVASSYSTIFNIESLTVLVLAFKSMKYFKLSHDLNILKLTLQQAVKDLLTFFIMMIVLFTGFVVVALNIFGANAEGYRDPVTSLGTLFLILLGEFDYEEMSSVSALWALVFFLIYVLVMFFIVLNIFLAILNDAYTTTKEEVKVEEFEKRKKLSLREKFEVRKAVWRERKKIAELKKLKKEKVKAAKKAKKEYEKRAKEKALLSKIGRKKAREQKKVDKAVAAKEAASAAERGEEVSNVKSSTRTNRRSTSKLKPFG